MTLKALHHLKRHCSFLSTTTTTTTIGPPTTESQILQHCRDASLSKALTLLNKTHNISSSHKSIIYASLLQTSTKTHSFLHGTVLHCHVIKSGLDTDRFVGNSLLALYFKLAPLFYQARRIFDGLLFKDVISWTSIISGYIHVGDPKSSLMLFSQMVGLEGLQPNAFTLSSVIKACSELGFLRLGRCFHGVVVSRGFDSNRVVSSALIDMYGRNFGVEDARKMFDELLEPDTVCWTSVISALTRNDMFKEAVELFYRIHRGCGLAADGFTFGTLLAACGNLGWLRQGREVHAKVVTSGICGNVVVESSLLDMYGKCGSVGQSRIVFDRMSNKNSVSWTAMLGTYCHNQEYETVLNLVRESGIVDIYSFGTILRACSGLAAARQGEEVHCMYVRKGGWRDIIVESALVDLYAKCGCIDFAYRLFLSMQVRNLITWNSMIGGFAQNGKGMVALALFEDMIKGGMQPDYITFINVLFACSHTGLVNEGREYFTLMTKKYEIQPGVEHYNCMIDLLGRAELIEEAEILLENSDCRDDQSLWAVLLGACTRCSDYITAERIAKKMIELQPGFHLSYVLLGNIYRTVGRWNDALAIRKLMEDRGVRKMPGKSWIESENQKGSHFDLANMSIAGKSSTYSMEGWIN
ncbi:pentatricopeptide repeat-containing protein At1g03540-like [Arachis stenosperma]|uniref:pentatricopeptide repeat-containing protein At1g03540-like n=1 Tax=Arachis stenosperma TaxID=217475 RepID=UPI0025AD7EDF|nr:pentatricopeptide repeat-containing protein At1g03540-like [Arachis stenosperma]XP_057753439.1 pentatricopeptide repeat-containing protein At1g03540-like [Arachis stenosperma]